MMQADASMNPPKTAHREQCIPNPNARLRDQVHEAMRFKQFSSRTEAAYWNWIRKSLYNLNRP
jgi:hypothetical protein